VERAGEERKEQGQRRKIGDPAHMPQRRLPMPYARANAEIEDLGRASGGKASGMYMSYIGLGPKRQ
jgi:hypothetical protein